MKARIYANVVKAIAAAVAIVLSCTAWALEWNDGTYTWSYVENGDGTVSMAKEVGEVEASISPKPTGAFKIPSKINGKPLTKISFYAFLGCTGMTAVTIPASVTDINAYAFANCTGLKTVVIPSGVTSIGEDAFYNCEVLDYVTVPDSVTSIANEAFHRCAGLNYAVVPTAFGSDSEKTRIFGSTSAAIVARDVKVEIVDGIGLAYTVSDGEATVGGGASDYAIPKDTAGAVTIPATLDGCPVTAIGECAFMHCIGLTSVTIPSGVTSIDEDAFRGCIGLASVTIPSGVTSIGSFAFYSCDVLNYVTVPDSVTSIGNDAFADCAGLKYAVVPTAFGSDSEKTRIFGSTSAAIVARDVKVEIVYGVAWAYTVSDGEATVGGGADDYAISPSTADAVTIPSKLGGCPVTAIGRYAFLYCDGLTSVTIPSGVTSIGVQAFYQCDSLTSVTIPSGVTSIGMEAFYGCDMLDHVTIPNGVTSIGARAFYGCKVLDHVTVPDSVTDIGNNAFADCAGLDHAVVPTAFGSDSEKTRIFGSTSASIVARDVKVEIVDDIPWAYTVSGGKATVGGGASDYAIPKDTAGAVTIPATLGGCPVTTIGGLAFMGCRGLTSVTIPFGVTSIDMQAFYGCDNLGYVTLPNSVTRIREHAFKYCRMLDYVTVPDSVTDIASDAFAYCAGLHYAVVPTAFGSDSEKTRIFGSTSASIVARDVKVEIVDDIPWAYTVSGGKATVGGGADDYAISPSTAGAVTIPATLGGCPVTTIGGYAFYGCDALASVTIPSGVTSIGVQAFENCSVLNYVTVPDSVTDIGNNAFAYCAGLHYAVVPTAFGSDSEKERIFVTPPSNIAARDVKVEIVDGIVWAYTVSDGEATVGGGADDYAISPSTAGAVTIPATLGGCPVTKIDIFAFYGCAGLTSVTIPSGVTSIGFRAFENCSVLNYVTVPDSVTDIGNNVFAKCAGLSNAVVPTAFGSASEKTRIFGSTSAAIVARDVKVEIVDGIGLAYTVSDGKATVGGGAYDYAIHPSTAGAVTIPATLGGCPVTAIGRYAFLFCDGLTSVTIPSGVTSIGVQAFYGCAGLTSVTIPSGVMSIGDNAFYGCDGLTSVTIPDSVTSIGSFAFYGCGGLATVHVVPGDADRVRGLLKWSGYSTDGLEFVEDLTAKYTVTLDANGGMVSGAATVSFQVEYGKYTSQAGANRTVSRSGYTLRGWYDAKSGGNMVFDARGYAVNGAYWNGAYSPSVSSATWKGAGNVIAYAQWVATPPYRIVTFDANGGVLGNASCNCVVEQGKYTSQAGASVLNATRSGYTLVGWYDAKSGGNMVFDAQGYAVNGTYWNGSYVPSKSAATWKYAGSVTAYARWAQNKSTVTLNANGGTVSGAATVSFQVEYGKYTSQAGANRTVSRSGYTLRGWYDAKSGGNMVFDARGYAVNGTYWNGAYSPSVSSATWKGAGNVTAYAQWVATPPYRIVTFDANGGALGNASCNCVVEQGKYTSQAGASVMKATRSGYTLVGWYDAKSGGNMVFDARGYAVNGTYWNGAYSPSVSSATWKGAGNVIAYAQWVATPPYRIVTFDANGGALGNASCNCVVEQGKYTSQAGASVMKATRSGYTLVGWYDAKSGGNMVFNAQGYAINGTYWNGSYVPSKSAATWKYAGSVTAYARWAQNTSTVTLNANGGTVSGVATVSFSVEYGKYTSQAGANRTVSRSGYALVGWFDTSAASGGNMVFNARGYAVNGTYWSGAYSPSVSSATWKGAGNVTAYARWVKTPPYRVVTFDANGGAIGNAAYNAVVVEDGKYTMQAGASGVKATRSGYTLVGWYDAKSGGNMVFNAQGYAVNGTYWNGSYVPSKSAATWKYAGNVIAYARWVAASGNIRMAAPSGNMDGDFGAGDMVEAEAPLFFQGEYEGVFADGGGRFMLTLDEGLETAYFVTWTDDGGVACECEAAVAGDVLILKTETGEVYHLVWDDGILVATRIE